MEEIQKVITELASKIEVMRSSLAEVKTTNIALKSEIELLQQELFLKGQEAKDFKIKYDDLMQRFEQVEENSTMSQPNNDAQIDALVREIDDCISRLKS